MLIIIYDGLPGPTGPTGPSGPSGADGMAATITAGTATSVAYNEPLTVTNSGTSNNAVFDFEIPAARPGETIIPYAVTEDLTPRTNSSGVLNRTNLMGFGNATGNISVTNGTSFTLDSDSEFLVFTMPYDGVITTVSGQYSTVASWRAPSNMRLYIGVAIAKKDSNLFTIEETSKAFAEPYVQGTLYDNREPRSGIAKDLNIKVLQGERIAVFPGYQNEGGTVGLALPFNFTGSIAIGKI